MHQTRQETTKKLPIKRKGTKYVVRALSNPQNSVPVLIAMRDMLNLVKTNKEVKSLIHHKMLKINNRIVRDFRESISLFNLFEAGKTYILKLSPTRKFFFEETKDTKERLCKVIGKRISKKGIFQLNLHDGTNLLSNNDKIKIGDSLYLSLDGKIKKHVPLEKGSEVFIVSGRYEGQHGKVADVSGKTITIRFKEGSSILNIGGMIAL